MDPDMEMFILIGPCSDLCHIKWVNGWVCLSFVSLLVPFLTIPSCWWKIACDPAMPQISKTIEDETAQLVALVRENVAFCDQGSDDYSTSSSLKQTSNDGVE